MRVVLCCGVFDLLHVGHVRHLREAAKMGDTLIVGVTMDSHVGKPGRPIIPEMERLEMVKALACVADATLCTDSMNALQVWRPNIFAKGYDRFTIGLLPEETEFCNKHNIIVQFTKPNPLHTTEIIQRCELQSLAA